jgi:hypothetical protein
VRRAPEVFSINAEELAAELGDRAANQGPGPVGGHRRWVARRHEQQHQQREGLGDRSRARSRTSNLAGEWLLHQRRTVELCARQQHQQLVEWAAAEAERGGVNLSGSNQLPAPHVVEELDAEWHIISLPRGWDCEAERRREPGRGRRPQRRTRRELDACLSASAACRRDEEGKLNVAGGKPGGGLLWLPAPHS